MDYKENVLFQSLLQEVGNRYLSENNASSENIKDWKGSDILYFQDDLMSKTKTTVSEKWFYTYVKNEPHKLPRIDMLNTLSRYAGYRDWSDYVSEHENLISNGTKEELPKSENAGQVVAEVPKIKEEESTHSLKKHKFNRNLSVILGTTLVLVLCIVAYFFLSIKKYTFCFYDEDRNTLLQKIPIDIKILKGDGESPIEKQIRSGCLDWETYDDYITMVVSTPYHKTDTIYRKFNSHDESETIYLQTNDHALMFHYFSQSNVKDWKKRRRFLEDLIDDNAVIYQVFDNDSYGIEVLSKEDYIDLITTFTNTLQNMEIIETKYNKNKIELIKFRVHEEATKP